MTALMQQPVTEQSHNIRPERQPAPPIPGRCNAQLPNKPLGVLCRHGAGKRTDHVGVGACYRHGGCTPNASTNARERTAEAAVLRLATGTAQPVHDPIAELSRLAGEVRADYQAARHLVADLVDQDRLIVDGHSGPDLDPIVKFWERNRDALHRVLAEMAKLGFTERQIAIDQASQQVLMVTIAAFLTDQGLDAAKMMPDLGARLQALEVGGTEV